MSIEDVVTTAGGGVEVLGGAGEGVVVGEEVGTSHTLCAWFNSDPGGH